MLENNKFVTIKLRKDNEIGYYRWTCPKCTGTFTYSSGINHQWGIPRDKVYCAVCNILYDFEKEIEIES